MYHVSLHDLACACSLFAPLISQEKGGNGWEAWEPTSKPCAVQCRLVNFAHDRSLVAPQKESEIRYLGLHKYAIFLPFHSVLLFQANANYFVLKHFLH